MHTNEITREAAARFRGSAVFLLSDVFLILMLPSAMLGQTTSDQPIDFGVWATYRFRLEERFQARKSAPDFNASPLTTSK